MRWHELKVGSCMDKNQFRQTKPFQEKKNIPMPELGKKQDMEAKQNFVPFTALHEASSTLSPKTGSNLSTSVQRIISGLARLQDLQPEGLSTRGLQAVKPKASLGALPLLTFTNAFGLLVVSFSYYLSVSQYGNLVLEFFFFLGLLFMFVPNLLRLLSPASSRFERICLLCVLGIYFYLVHYIASPLYFSWYDETLHWRTVDDILRTGHLFSQNPMLPVSPYYPGLEIITSAISTLTGTSTFYAGVIIVGVSRLLMVSSLFLFYERITNSSRMAGITILIYMINPHFIFFDAQFSYETLALPLATFMLYILARYESADKDHRWVIVTAWIVLVVVTVTHHMTDYVFIGLLILWALVSLFSPSSRNTRIHLVSIALFGLVLAFAYALLLPKNPVWGYLSQYFEEAFSNLEHIITGTSAARPLFVSADQPSPIWDRLLMTASVALSTICLPFGLFSLFRHHRYSTLAVMLGIFSLAYPITQVFRFTQLGAEITDRAAAFLFLPVAYVLTLLITHFWPTRKLTPRVTSLITCLLLVVFMGGVIIQSGPVYSSVPGPYIVVADARSVEAEGIQAAIWSRNYLGPNNRVATDRINQMLMNTFGDQQVVASAANEVDISPIFFSSHFDPEDITILQNGKIHYLAVDLRLSNALPLESYYFNQAEVGQIAGPISKAALTKFNTIVQINRIFDSGDIVIYDTGAITNG